MRVLHVESGRHFYGGARQLASLIEGLESRGVENLLVCPPGTAIARVGGQHAEVLTLTMRGELDPTLVTRLAQHIRRTRPDLVHLHSRRGADLYGVPAAHIAGVPCILSRRVDNPPPPLLLRLVLSRCARVIAISRAISDVLVRAGLDARQLIVIPDAIDTARWSGGCDAEWFRREFALPTSAVTIGMLAQFIPRKGHRTLLDALPMILSNRPELRVLLFGRGRLEPEIRARIARDGLGAQVTCAGFRTDLERVLACLDLVVHPVAAEGLGVALLESAAAARPIVAGRAGGVPEVVRDGETGLLVPPRDPRALATAVVKLLDDPERARALGQAAHALVAREYALPRMIERHLALYREVLAST